MARTSKKKQETVENAAIMHPSKVYSVGIYARLSVDGDDRKNESIETQIEIVKAFINQQKDMRVFDCYTDIGKTGTNFEREGFERMMCDVRMRKVDCIIVKDLSRFGRNHIETGNYIEKIFPFLGVRFIAVTDNFDSMNISGSSETLSVNLKNLVNELYAKDIAVKVKSSKKAKWEQGSYTGGIPPYGYRAEWIGGKKCLFVEETTASIVKNIFQLFLSGKNMTQIVSWLYEEKIVTPTQYHMTGQVYCSENNELRQWSKASIKWILKNPVYIGCLIQGRTCGKDYMLRSRHDIDLEDCSINEHMHEAIISEDIFFAAAAQFEKNSIYCNRNQDGFSKTTSVDEDIFADVLFCGDCGSKLTRITVIKEFSSKGRVRIYRYNCPNYDRIDAYKCASRSISLHALQNIVKETIRQEFSLSEMRPKKLVEINNQEAECMKKEWNRKLVELERRIENITKQRSEQYLKYRMGEVDAETFKRWKEEEDKKAILFQKERADISEELRTIDAQTARKNHFLRALVKGNDKTELTSEVIRTLINRIEIYPDHRVKVIFAFQRNDILPRKKKNKK